MDGRPKGTRRWADLFSLNRLFSQDNALQYMLFENNEQMTLEDDDVDTIKTVMGDCLVGRFVGRFLGWLAIKAMAKHLNVKYDINVHKTMWLIFKFQSVEVFDRVMRGGPYVAHLHLVVLCT